MEDLVVIRQGQQAMTYAFADKPHEQHFHSRSLPCNAVLCTTLSLPRAPHFLSSFFHATLPFLRCKKIHDLAEVGSQASVLRNSGMSCAFSGGADGSG